jgi:hypothetical protein
MMVPRRLVRPALFILLTLPPATSIRAQTPARSHPGGSELPRFTLREIITGRNDSISRIPGPWLGAATAASAESLAVVAYRAAAARSGIAPLEGTALVSQRSQHVLGLYRRAELLSAARRTLEAIRNTIPFDTTRARFDFLFRPRGEWIVDLHDAALAWARERVPGITWATARTALSAVGWLPKSDTSDGLEAIPRALYGLAVLAANDTAAFKRVRSALERADARSAEAISVLLGGYGAGQRWFADAVAFFLTQPWAPAGSGGYSLGDYVREDWHRIHPSLADSAALSPEIRPRLFGYPQAVPYYGVPPALFGKLVKTHNETARQWLTQQGAAALLHVLRRLPVGDTSLTLLQAGSETVRLTTVPRQARESLNGFLEPHDAIAIDPGYSPLLALGALVHEWQHLLFRRLQLEAAAARLPRSPPTILELPGIQPHVAEGFAEWSAERILAPLVARWPLLGVGELEKRAAMARESADDQHSLGYALVVELARAVKDPGTTTGMLLRYANDPQLIMNEGAVRRAWIKHRRTPDYVFAAPAHRILIPEVTFTVEDGYPDIIETRILVPPGGKGGY